MSVVGVLLGSFLIAYIIFKCKLQLYWAVLILFLVYYGFRVVNYESGIRLNQYGEMAWYAFSMPKTMVTQIALGSLNFSIPLAASLASTIFVIIKFINGTLFIRNKTQSMIIKLWLISVIPALYGFWKATELGNDGATVGLRYWMTMSSLFWGIHVGIANSDNTRYYSICVEFIQTISKVILIGIVLFLGGLLQGHFNFLLTGFATSYLIYRLDGKRKYFWSIMLIGFYLIVVSTRFTFTYKGILVFTAVVMLVITKFPQKLYMKFKNRFYIAVVGSIIFMAVGTYYIRAQSGVNLISKGSNATSTMDRLRDKLLDDRAIVWTNTINLIIEPPYIFVPAGRTFFYEHIVRGKEEWTVGSHNLYLEIFRQLGFFTGTVIIFIMMYAMKGVVGLLRLNLLGIEKVIVSALIGIFVAYGSTLHTLINEGLGFVFWSLIGIYQIIIPNVISLSKKSLKESYDFTNSVIND